MAGNPAQQRTYRHYAPDYWQYAPMNDAIKARVEWQ